MDDWQDHALSTRHMHNRNSRRGSGKGKKGGLFDVRKTFGEYEVKCASWERALGESEQPDSVDEEASLELLRLTDDGQGVLGELILPGVLRASVVLAASRKALAVITRVLSGADEDSDEEEEDEDQEEDDDQDEDDQEQNRFTTFEKNSFRTPKFWLAWNGTIILPPSSSPPPSPTLHKKHSLPSDSPPPSPTLHRTGSSFPPPKPSSALPSDQFAEGLGYITFTHNECRKFKGTLNCRELGWKDISLSGFKSVSRSQSDRQLLWAGRDAETGTVEGDEEEDRGARVDARRRVIFER